MCGSLSSSSSSSKDANKRYQLWDTLYQYETCYTLGKHSVCHGHKAEDYELLTFYDCHDVTVRERGKLYSDVAADWGERYIHWKKFKKHNPIDTKTAAKEMEKKIAIKYRDKGYAVWSDQLPYLDPKKNKDK